MIPALLDAVGDVELRGAPLVVYFSLALNDLDPVEHRPVKQAALALRLQLSERTVREAMNMLVDRGYIERGQNRPSGGDGPSTFRLIYNRAKTGRGGTTVPPQSLVPEQ